jgi:hypothetical protein
MSLDLLNKHAEEKKVVIINLLFHYWKLKFKNEMKLHTCCHEIHRNL